MIFTLIGVGKLPKARTEDRVLAMIRRLLAAQPRLARLVRAGAAVDGPSTAAHGGDIVLVRPTPSSAVDGSIVEGFCTVDESVLAAQVLPTDKRVGASMFGATLNRQGAFKFWASNVGSESAAGNNLQLMKAAVVHKASLHALVHRVSTIFVPEAVLLAPPRFLLVSCHWRR